MNVAACGEAEPKATTELVCAESKRETKKRRRNALP